MADQGRRERLRGAAVAYWAVTGTLLGIGATGLLGYGLALVPAGAVLTVIGLAVPALRGRESAAGLCGMSVGPALVAAANPSGPGTVCTTTAEGALDCYEQLSPWPWAAAVVVLIAVGWQVLRLGGGRAPATAGGGR